MAYRIAFLADVDNYKMDDRDLAKLIAKAELKGEIVYGKIYNYNQRKCRAIADVAEDNGFDVVTQTMQLRRSKKSLVDMRIVIDAIRLSEKNKNIDAFCLIVGDGDFVPLISALKADGKYVIGSFNNEDPGNEKVCNEVIKLDRNQKTKTAPVIERKRPAVKKPVKQVPKYDIDDDFDEDYEEEVEVIKPRPEPKPQVQPQPQIEQTYQPQMQQAYQPQPQMQPQMQNTTSISREEMDAQLKAIEESRREDEIRARKQKLADKLESFAQRTSDLNFDADEDIEAKKLLLHDIDECLKDESFDDDSLSDDEKKSFAEIKELVKSLRDTISSSMEE